MTCNVLCYIFKLVTSLTFLYLLFQYFHYIFRKFLLIIDIPSWA